MVQVQRHAFYDIFYISFCTFRVGRKRYCEYCLCCTMGCFINVQPILLSILKMFKTIRLDTIIGV